MIFTNGEIDYKKNKIICKMPSVGSDMKLKCDISLSGTDGNNEVIYLTSQGFNVTVAKSQANDEAIEADDNLPILVQLINEISAISNVEVTRVVAEDKRVIVEEKRCLHEDGRVNAEDGRNFAERTRENSESLREEADRNRQEIINDLWLGIESLNKSKQNLLSFDGNYNGETNKVATVETVIQKIAELVANAPEELNTLKELADWIGTHNHDAAGMNSRITSNEKKTDELSESLNSSINAINTSMENMRNDILGASGTVVLYENKWVNNTYNITIDSFGENDAIFFSPFGLEDKHTVEELNVFTATTGNNVIFTAEKVPLCAIKMNYFIARGNG